MIDTASKRASCIGIGLLFLRTGIAPTGGGVSSAERLHVQGLYSGIGDGLIFDGGMIDYEFSVQISREEAFAVSITRTETMLSPLS